MGSESMEIGGKEYCKVARSNMCSVLLASDPACW